MSEPRLLNVNLDMLSKMESVSKPRLPLAQMETSMVQHVFQLEKETVPMDTLGMETSVPQPFKLHALQVTLTMDLLVYHKVKCNAKMEEYGMEQPVLSFLMENALEDTHGTEQPVSPKLRPPALQIMFGMEQIVFQLFPVSAHLAMSYKETVV